MQDGVEGGANKNGRDAAEVEPGVAEDLIRVYLVVADIRIVDCHMYPGEPCPQVMYSHIYWPRPQCNTSASL